MNRTSLRSVFATLAVAGAVFSGSNLAAVETDIRPQVRPAVSVYLEGWRNVDGGLAVASTWNALTDVAVEIDGTVIGASAGGLLVAQAHWVANRNHNQSFSETTGAFAPVSGNMANDHVRVYNLHYRQESADQRWAFKAGLIAADDDFMLSEYAAFFAYSAFGAMPSQVATPLGGEHVHGAAFAVYPVSAPGIWLELKAAESMAWQTGVYHGGVGPDTDANDGFTWANARRSGVAGFSELRWTSAAAPLPTTVRVGVAVHTGRFNDFAAVRGGRILQSRGLYSAFAVVDKLVRARSDGRPAVGVFGRFGVSPQRDRAVVLGYADAGVNWFGPLPGRAGDLAGIAVSWTHFGAHFRELAGVASSETTVEMAYRAQLSPHFAVQLHAQALFNPAPNAASGRRETALVLGVRTALQW